MNEVKLDTPGEFYDVFSTVASSINKNKKLNPMRDEEIARITIPKYRDNAETLPLPASLRAILQYDRDFTIYDQPVLSTMLKKLDANFVLQSATIGDTIREVFHKGFKKLPPTVEIWNDGQPMPGMLEIYDPGDQKIFLYAGIADASGEYPVARFDNQPEVWISDSSLIQYVLAEAKYDEYYGNIIAPREGLPIKFDFDFTDLQKEAKTKNARFIKKEWWAENEELAAFMNQIDV